MKKIMIAAAVIGSALALGWTAKADAKMYRLYNPNSGEHFYTAGTNERDSLINVGWNSEGFGWVAPDTGAPVYRIYNPNAKGGDHHYTMNRSEAEYDVSVGWRWDNNGEPVFYSGGSVPLYRAYNPNAAAGSHNYTVDNNEQNNLISVGWRDEGVSWYGTEIGGSDSPSQQLPNTGAYASAPVYFSQRDPRWSGVPLNAGTVGPEGCVPTSLAMILVGSYGIATDPGQVARKMDVISNLVSGCGGRDLMNTVPLYGRSIEEISSADRAKSLLQQGVPLIFYVNVGVGHAVVAYGLNADGNSTMVLDPMDQKFYSANTPVSVDSLFASLSRDSADWDAGTPVFAIK